jgi:hypothetical protein
MPQPKEQDRFCTKSDGYIGAWHSQAEKFPHGWKYSGGLGTYCSSHAPFAIYAPEADRTFFCWGGMHRDKTKVPLMTEDSAGPEEI